MARTGSPKGAVSAPDRKPSTKLPPLERPSFPEWCALYLIQSVDQWAGKPVVSFHR
jgi:hypothetical protein